LKFPKQEQKGAGMTAGFDQRPTGTQIAKHSWTSLGEALGAMPSLFISAIAIAVVLALVTFVEPHSFRAVLVPGARADIGTVVVHLAVTLAITVVWAAAAAPVAVATHRFILLDRTTSGIISWSPAYTRSFFLWTVALRLVTTGIISIIVLALPSVMAGLLLAVAEIALLVILIHVAMIFPAVATEVPSEGWQARIAKSWNEMRGNSWLLVRAAIIAFLPLVLGFILLEVIFFRQLGAGLGNAAEPFNSVRLIVALVIGFLEMPGVALGAALASWMYAWIRQQPIP
jgi:hypothetical protein